MRKNKFNIFFILTIFAFLFLAIASSDSDVKVPTDEGMSVEIDIPTDFEGTIAENYGEKISLEDVEKWYNNQMPAVSQSLMEYSESVDGLTYINVTSSKFLFGEDSGWYDCHYTFYFRCKIDNVIYSGEARAFMKYNDSEINWFHFEIFDNDTYQPIVEHYDESYDETIEAHYKELVSIYN